jgi:folate-binding protein YgfZ
MTDTCFARLDSRALIAVTGEGWRGFLQGLITNDVERLGPGEMRFAALLAPQGRLLFDMFVIGGEDGCWLDVQAALREELIQRLTIYRLRAKVDIEAVEGSVFALFPSTSEFPREGGDPSLGTMASARLDGPPPSRGNSGVGAWIEDPRLPTLGGRGVDTAPPDGAIEVDEAAYDAHRLGVGVPDPARDCVPDKTYPLEANFDLLNGVDFQKGCFIGQETTSRMKRRGAIKSRMLPIDFDGRPPAFGAEVLAGELRAGEVLSGRDGRAMALLRLDRIEGAELSVEGRPVRPVRPDWMEPSLALVQSGARV